MKEVFKRWAQAINSVEATLKEAGYGYAHNEHLGYITTCPSNVGTGLRASVMLKLPKLYKKMGRRGVDNSRQKPAGCDNAHHATSWQSADEQLSLWATGVAVHSIA